MPSSTCEPWIWYCFAGTVSSAQFLACGFLFEGPSSRPLRRHFCGGSGAARWLGKPRLSASQVIDPGRPRRMPRAVATGPRGVRVHLLSRLLNGALRSVL